VLVQLFSSYFVLLVQLDFCCSVIALTPAVLVRLSHPVFVQKDAYRFRYSSACCFKQLITYFLHVHFAYLHICTMYRAFRNVCCTGYKGCLPDKSVLYSRRYNELLAAYINLFCTASGVMKWVLYRLCGWYAELGTAHLGCVSCAAQQVV
jgi:hypothetical protein